MQIDLNDYIDIDNIEHKDEYSNDEKKYILDTLENEELLHSQEKYRVKTYKKYSKEDKKKILEELNEKRLDDQRYEDIKRRRTTKKQIYKFGIKEFYKFENMSREYYIDIEDIQKISSRPSIVSLYYRVFGELKKKDFLMKIQKYSDKFYISDDILRVYFKTYSLERKRDTI
jgi:hypothetical protein